MTLPNAQPKPLPHLLDKRQAQADMAKVDRAEPRRGDRMTPVSSFPHGKMHDDLTRSVRPDVHRTFSIHAPIVRG